MPSVQAEINELQIYSLQQFTTSPFIEIEIFLKLLWKKDFFSIGAPTELITTFITLSFPVSNGFVIF